MSEYEVGEIPPEELERQKKRPYLSNGVKEPKTSYIEKMILGEEERAIADKAAKLIARDYGEVLKRLEDE